MWQKYLLEALLCPIQTVIEVFKANNNVGVVIPDIPDYFRYNPLFLAKDSSIYAITKKLWERMGCKKMVSFDERLAFVMPYGTMFWYRPVALHPLFNLHLSDQDISDEPLPTDETILYCLERLIVYIAWEMGYDYRIIISEKNTISGFVDSVLYTKYFSTQIISILQSRTYRIGKLVMTFPKLIRKLIKNLRNF
jgi:rhamnosyltransferase